MTHCTFIGHYKYLGGTCYLLYSEYTSLLRRRNETTSYHNPEDHEFNYLILIAVEIWDYILLHNLTAVSWAEAVMELILSPLSFYGTLLLYALYQSLFSVIIPSHVGFCVLVLHFNHLTPFPPPISPASLPSLFSTSLSSSVLTIC